MLSFSEISELMVLIWCHEIHLMNFLSYGEKF